MFGFFSKNEYDVGESVVIDKVNEETGSDWESDYEEEDVEHEPEDIEPEDIVLQNKVCRCGKATFFKTSARDLIHIPNWTYQRCLNDNHVEDLIKNFKIDSHAIGTTKALRNPEGKLRIIDGQHRLAAWKKIMEQDDKWNAEVLLEIYETDSFDSALGMNVFKQANNVKSLDVNDFPDEVTGRIMTKFKLNWPGMLRRVSEGKRVNRPRLDSRKLCEKLKEYLVHCKMSEEKLWDEIITANREMGMWTHKNLKCSAKTLDKARLRGFYLGLDSEMSWLDRICIEDAL